MDTGLRRSPGCSNPPGPSWGRCVGEKGLPQGPGLLCSISSSESVIRRILSYRLGGEFLSSVLGKDQRGGVAVGWEKSIPTTLCLATALVCEGGQKYPSQCDRGAGSGLHQCGFLLLKGANCEPIPYLGLSEQRVCSGTYTATPEEQKTLTQGMSLERPS